MFFTCGLHNGKVPALGLSFAARLHWEGPERSNQGDVRTWPPWRYVATQANERSADLLISGKLPKYALLNGLGAQGEACGFARWAMAKPFPGI